MDFILPLLIFAAALLYSSVGHAGASGYLAAMALMGVEPAVMKPAALFLNVLVASIGTIRFYRAGCFSWQTFWPFALGAAPMALLGGWITLPGTLYKQLVGLVLLYAAYRMFALGPKVAQASSLCQESHRQDACATGPRVSPALAIACGAGIGLLSGLTGTGGGIFLSPLLVLSGWADVRHAAGVSVAFILVNSISGLVGHMSRITTLPDAVWVWAVAAVAGGLIGSTLGSRRFSLLSLRRLLAVVLVIAAVKMILV